MAGTAKIRKYHLITAESKTTRNMEILLVIIAILGLANLFISIIPTMIFAFLILFIQFFTLNKYESAFLFSLFAGTIGAFFAIKGIRGVGSFFILLSFIVFLFDFKQLIKKYLMAIIPLLIIFAWFSLSVLSTKGGDFATEKLTRTVISGLMTSFAFAHFLYNNYKYRPYLVSIFTIVYALFVLKYSMEYYGFTSPKNIFEFGYIRNMLSEIRISDFDIKINYQGIGFMGALALSFLFFETKSKISKYVYVVIYTLSVIVVLYSGSRQAMLTLIIIISLHILRNNSKPMNLSKYVYFFLFVALIVYGLQRLDVWFISDLRNSGSLVESSGRSDLIDVGMKQFTEHPITGVGYGRYINPDNEYGGSPHNIVVELLAETGFLGLFLLLSILFVFFVNHFSYLKTNAFAFFGVFCVLITFLIRSLVSADMSYNIELFTVLFMLPLFRSINRKIYKLSSK